MLERITARTARNTVVAGSLLALGLFAGSVIPANANSPSWAPAHGYRRKADTADPSNWANQHRDISQNQIRRWHRTPNSVNMTTSRERQREYWAHRNSDRANRYEQQARLRNEQREYWAHRNADRMKHHRKDWKHHHRDLKHHHH